MVVGNMVQERISRLEGAYEQVDRRLNDMNSRLDEMNSRFNETNRAIAGLRDEMNNRFGEMSTRYNTLIMIMIASWVTVIAALITIFLK